MLLSIKQRWVNMTVVSKVIFVALLISLLIIFAYSLIWVFKEDYQVLFSDLNPQDASAMVSELDHLKTPYKLTENGTTILVASDSVYKTRLKLIGKGMNLNGSVGFELFNNSEFGMTEFAQKVNYLRALQGELERTIVGFDEIKSARVHLVLPESGLFKRKDANKTKASVTVIMKKGYELTQEQITGIQRLVSSSVPDLSSGEVTIVDQKGVALTKDIIGSKGVANIYERLDVKKQIEIYVTSKIADVLDKVLGSGKAIVSVDVDLNYDQVQVTKEDIIPLPNTYGQSVGAIARKKTTSQVDEMAGQAENITGDQALKNAASPANASTSEIEFLNNKRVEQVLSSPGTINKLSVGVIIPDMNDPDKLRKIKEVVSMVAGINLKRGDGLIVQNIDIPVASTNEDSLKDEIVGATTVSSDSKTLKKKETLPINYIYILGILGLAIIVFFAIRFNRKNDKKSLSNHDREVFLNEINKWASS